MNKPSPPKLKIPRTDKYSYSGQADGHHMLVAAMEVVNAAGLCLFGYLSYPFQAVLDQLGMDFLIADMGKIRKA